MKLPHLVKKVHVLWNGRLTSTAGNAYHETGKINLNPRLQDISEKEIYRTVNHELAHLVAYARAGRQPIRAHGSEWKQACSDLGIPGETRCHELPLPRRKQTPRYAYRCSHCNELLLRVRPLKRYSACYDCCKNHGGGKYGSAFAYKRVALPKDLT